MRECAVGFRHLVRILALLDGAPPVVRRIEQLGREPLGHGFFIALARGRNDPADAERLTARRSNFHRHLVGGAADAPRAHLDRRHDVVERLLEHGHRVLLGLALDDLEGAIDDRFGNRLLSLVHHRVHELGNDQVPVLRVGIDFALFGGVTAGHGSLISLKVYLGRLAPYFERRCLRFLTPCVSSTPRRMWYRTPGRSFTRPPRIITTECSCRLWPSPGIYPITSKPLVSLTLATLRNAEFGFLGVVV